MSESNIKLTIGFQDSDLDEEQLDEVTQNLLHQMRELDEVEQVERVQDPNPPQGNKSFGAALVGILTAEVNGKNIKAVLGFLSERLSGKQIQLEVEANGKKLKVKASSRQELLDAIQAAEQFVASA